MQGFLFVPIGDGEQLYELPRSTAILGSSPSASFQITAPSVKPEHCSLTWNQGTATWSVGRFDRSDGTIRINGRILSTMDAPLEDHDRLSIGNLHLRFRRVPSRPYYLGSPVFSLPIPKPASPLVFGTSSTLPAGQAVLLDSEDPDISPVHLTIETSDKHQQLYIIDQSRAGSLLNGRNFQRERLAIGDRFRIGSYNFEFTGYSIDRVSGISGGRVEARGLSMQIRDQKQGETKRILSDVNLDVERCAFVGILGGSGQGKSTLLNALCGIVPATSGHVFIEGVDLASAKSGPGTVGFVPQDDIVHTELTVAQAIHLSARLRLHSKIRKPEIDELTRRTMDKLGLTAFEHRRINRLSGGQRKRVSIATELLSKPEVLFLDEPSSGLDPAKEFKLMKLLRSLAGTDCTVLCTTHVLGRSYLFNELCFIQGGNLVFRGSGDLAVKHFGVEKLEEIYEILDESPQSGEEWRGKFEAAHPELVCSDPVLPQSPFFDDGVAPREARSLGFLHTVRVLFERQRQILLADSLNLAYLAAQPLVIGGLVGWVSDEPVLRMFLAIVATLWFGCSNGAQQIVREMPIFRRERVGGLGVHAYLHSKYLFLCGVTAFQALLLYLTTTLVTHCVWTWIPDWKNADPKQQEATRVRHSNFEEQVVTHYFGDFRPSGGPQNLIDRFLAIGTAPSDENAPVVSIPSSPLLRSVAKAIRIAAEFTGVDNALDASMGKDQHHDISDLLGLFGGTIGLRLGALLAAALVGVAIGLAISALVNSSTQAVMWVPLVLIPQILLGGFVITRPEMSPSVRSLSMIVPSFALQRIMDVSNVYGLQVPRMSNQTKLPLFLAPGEKETVTWKEEAKERISSYDRISEQNVSWQNLLVIPSRAGQHRFQRKLNAPGVAYKESVEYRGDVLDYPAGTDYRFLHAAWSSSIVLSGWIAVCYLVTAGRLAHSTRRN
jgi:ABC-type multidrug transport system ATPase subunit